jgi:FkbM family methyltransferase
MSMERPPANYRRLVYILLAIIGVSLATNAYAIWRFKAAEAQRGDPLFLDPIDTAPLRDPKLYTFTVTSNGYTYKGETGNYIDEHVLFYGAYEKYMLYFMRDYVRATGQKDSALIDVGANVGQHSLFMSRHVKEVHSIEPYPLVLRRFHEMVKLNNFDNIKIHEVGFSDDVGSIPYYPPPGDNLGAGTFRKEAVDWQTKEIKLPLVIGDDYLKSVEMPPVSVIKMDIEGYEEKGLRGLKKTLEKHRPLVVVEVTRPPKGTIATGEQLRRLFPEKYQFLWLDRRRDLMFNGKYELNELKPDPDRFLASMLQVDIVAFPEEKSGQVPRRKTEEEPKQETTTTVSGQ